MIELDGIAQERLGLDRILSDRGGSASIYVKLISQITFMHPALRVPPGGNQVDGSPPACSSLGQKPGCDCKRSAGRSVGSGRLVGRSVNRSVGRSYA